MFDAFVAYHARQRPEQPAIVTSAGGVTFAELDGTVGRFAQAVASIGLATNQPVSLSFANPVTHWIVVLALARLGVPSAPASDAAARSSALPTGRSRSAAHTCFTPPTSGSPPSNPAQSAMLPRPRPNPAGLGRVLTSSGTTGAHKRIALSWALIDANVRNSVIAYGPAAGGPWMLGPGIDTAVGFSLPLAAWAVGHAVFLNDRPGTPLPMTRFAPGLIGTVPVELTQLLRNLPPRFRPPQPLRLVVAGGRLPVDLAREARLRLTPDIRTVYGATECGTSTIADAALLDQHPEAAGYAMPDVSVEVVDPEGSPVRPGEQGEVRIGGSRLAAYLDPVEASGFRDGGFYPGDLGRLMPDGLLLIDGRTDEMINAGGIKLAPAAIEAAVAGCPGIVDAAAFARADGAGMERCFLAVVRDGHFDPQVLAARLASVLPPGVPVETMFVPAIPRNTLGKVQRSGAATPSPGDPRRCRPPPLKCPGPRQHDGRRRQQRACAEAARRVRQRRGRRRQTGLLGIPGTGHVGPQVPHLSEQPDRRARGRRYLEIGVHIGGTLCSAISKNQVTVMAIDDWSHYGNGGIDTFFNVARFRGRGAKISLLERDFRAVDYAHIGTYNVVFFDGPHEEQDQYDGATLPQAGLGHALHPDRGRLELEKVRNGTMRGLRDTGVVVEYAIELRTSLDGTTPTVQTTDSDWHNGLFMAWSPSDPESRHRPVVHRTQPQPRPQVPERQQRGVGDHRAGRGGDDHRLGDRLEVGAEMHGGFQHQDAAVRGLDPDMADQRLIQRLHLARHHDRPHPGATSISAVGPRSAGLPRSIGPVPTNTPSVSFSTVACTGSGTPSDLPPRSSGSRAPSPAAWQAAAAASSLMSASSAPCAPWRISSASSPVVSPCPPPPGLSCVSAITTRAGRAGGDADRLGHRLRRVDHLQPERRLARRDEAVQRRRRRVGPVSASPHRRRRRPRNPRNRRTGSRSRTRVRRPPRPAPAPSARRPPAASAGTACTGSAAG